MTHILLGIFLSLTVAASDTSTVNRYIREATEWMDSKPDTSLYLAETALELSRRIGYLEGEAQALSRQGIALHVTGRSEGFDQLTAAKDLFQKIGNEVQYAWTMINLANFHIDKGDYVTSTELLQSALETFTRLGLTQGMSGALLNLGEIRMTLGQLDEAMDLAQRSLALYESLEHLRGRSLALSLIGTLHVRQGQPKTAIPLLDEALKIAESRQDYRMMGSVTELLGMANEQMGNYESALSRFRESLELRNLIDDRISRVDSYTGIARILFRMGSTADALDMVTQAFEESSAQNLPKSMAESARLLYEIHKTSGDLPTALRYLEIYQSINSELLSAEKATAIANLEAVAELQRKKEQIDFLTNQRWLERVILAIVLMLLGLTVVFVIWIQRERQRVMSLANKLKDVGAQKDRILSIISHDLRGPLASLSSVIELLDMDLLSPDDWKELKPSLIRQFNGTDETLQDLLTWAKSQFEGVGMSAERRDKLFEGSGHTTLGTSGESGSGLGLVFVRDLVQRNGGRISVESTEGKGSVFTVALPMG